MDITTIKGFQDILPQETQNWQRMESQAREIFKVFGFKEIRTPLLEWTELFSRGIGRETDIVSKEMYTLTDSKGRGLTLRPEATASVVRAYIQHRLYQTNQVQKLYSIGPMFRHERPQKGRFRQFHQINAEIFGDEGPRSDADLINMAMRLFKTFGLDDLILNINSLGCELCRVEYKKELKKYLTEKSESFCPECKKRAELNPLRVFDCKVESCRKHVLNAPVIFDYICDNCKDHFRKLSEYLNDLNIPFVLNHHLVRGLDYYSRTTFEIQTDRLGSQNAVAGGGRYDSLVKQLGGPDHKGIGFAIGFERLVTLLEKDIKETDEGPEFFIIGLGEKAERITFGWVSELRKAGIPVEMEYATKGLKAQMKRADRVGAKRALIVGDDELSSGKGILRDMKTKEQEEVNLDSLVDNLKIYLVRGSD